MRKIVLGLLLFAAVCPTIWADQVNTYKFTGLNGLSGTFTLDANAAVIDIDPLGKTLRVNSPSDMLTGTFGPFEFSGHNALQAFGFTGEATPVIDSFWTVRAGFPLVPNLTSNTVAGRSITGINLTIDYGSGFIDPTLNPVIFPNTRIIYTLFYSDGQKDDSTVNSLQLTSTT